MDQCNCCTFLVPFVWPSVCGLASLVQRCISTTDGVGVYDDRTPGRGSSRTSSVGTWFASLVVFLLVQLIGVSVDGLGVGRCC